MSYAWQLTPAPTGDVPGPETFSAQGDAESWLGLHWRDLSEAGVAAVTLVADGETVYEMSLAAGE